jgi:hypothetical protein
MFKNVKIIVLYQNIGGHKGCIFMIVRINKVGGHQWDPEAPKIGYLIQRLILC